MLYYGRIFNPKLQIINEYQQIIHQFNFSYALIIVDPLNLENNIGKSSYNFDQIRNEFVNAHDKILSEFNLFIESSEEKKEEGLKL